MLLLGSCRVEAPFDLELLNDADGREIVVEAVTCRFAGLRFERLGVNDVVGAAGRDAGIESGP